MADRIVDKLTQERAATLALLNTITDERWTHAVSEEWTVRDLLTHLLNAEEDHCKVIALAARGEGHRLPTEFDLDAHNSQRLSERGTLTRDELLAQLAAQRERTLALYHKMDSEQLESAVRHPALGETTIGKIFRIIGLHEKSHRREIEAALASAG